MTDQYSHLLDQYHRDGFVILRDVIDDRLTKECEHFHHPMMRNYPFWIRVVSDQSLLDLAALFGTPFIKLSEGVALFSSHYFYSSSIFDKLFTFRCVLATKASHKQELTTLKDDTMTSNVLGSYTHRDEDIDQSQIFDIVLKPGDISIHHPNMIHGSEANTSDRRRCGLTIRYIAPTTECLDKGQPVMMMSGTPVPGINHYRSWPKYRPGYDFPFDGCNQWNEKRRIVPEDEPYFDRTDYEQMNQEIEDEVLCFISTLYEKTPSK